MRSALRSAKGIPTASSVRSRVAAPALSAMSPRGGRVSAAQADFVHVSVAARIARKQAAVPLGHPHTPKLPPLWRECADSDSAEVRDAIVSKLRTILKATLPTLKA